MNKPGLDPSPKATGFARSTRQFMKHTYQGVEQRESVYIVWGLIHMSPSHAKWRSNLKSTSKSSPYQQWKEPYILSHLTFSGYTEWTQTHWHETKCLSYVGLPITQLCLNLCLSWGFKWAPAGFSVSSQLWLTARVALDGSQLSLSLDPSSVKWG